MQIIQRASPTERIMKWVKKNIKSRAHVNVWKKHPVGAPLPECHGKHPCMASGSMVQHRRTQGKAVRNKLTEILVPWKTEHTEETPGVTLSHKMTQ